MQRPEDNTVVADYGVVDTFDIAAEYIKLLDEKFNLEDVKKITEWMFYLSTQS
jgi:hypothetical protein